MNSSLDFLLLLVAAVALIGFLIVRRLRRLDDTGSTPNEFRIAAFYPRIARQAGFEPRTFLPMFAVGTVIAACLLPLLLIEIGSRRDWAIPVEAIVAAALIGIGATHLWLHSTRKERMRKIEWSLPYFLDLIVAFLRSGLGLEESFRRAGREGFHPDQPLAREVALVAREIDLGKDRPAAFRALAARTGVQAMKAIAAALESGMRLGASVEATLRAQSELLRNRRREDTLKRLQLAAVKALVPVVLCGLPLFVVIVFFPAIMEIGRTFGALFATP
jgi:pilus assembly protein TadC